jgi:signal transduction histidine kinase
VTTLALAAEVSARWRGEQGLRATSEKLREAMAELEAFSHSISHDLRSPVGAVLNYSAIIEEDFGARLGEEGLRLLRRIRSSSEAAVSLLDQLLQLGWLGREREEVPIDMASVARHARSEIMAADDEAGDVEIELQDLPPAWGSAELLRCVFRNLFSNAVKYTRGRDARRVQVGGVAGERENIYYVADHGIGFDPRLGDGVFQPLRRPTGARRHEGSGLGLAIVAKIIHKHRGRVWAESDGSSGARFSFTLPSTRNDHDADR